MSIQWASESDIRAAIADVRKDTTLTDWMLVVYEAPNSSRLVLEGSGMSPTNKPIKKE